jgi:putative transposase
LSGFFKDFGLPLAIRTDNGVPFASNSAFFGLSQLSVWWLRLGIAIERIKPGRPQQNGRHGRMHLTLEKEATKPPAKNFLQQQAKFDRLPKLDYPLHDRIVTVTSCGRLCIGRRTINLSRAFAGQDVGIREVAEKIWLVTFMHYDLGFFDHETGRVECAPNPFETQVLPISPV